MNVKPIRPDQITERRQESLPDFVIEAFNELIVKHCENGYASFSQENVVQLIVSKGRGVQKGLHRGHVFDHKWLNVEEIYRKAGWKVEYSRPDPGETGSAYFHFSKKV